MMPAIVARVRPLQERNIQTIPHLPVSSQSVTHGAGARWGPKMAARRRLAAQLPMQPRGTGRVNDYRVGPGCGTPATA